MTQEDLIRTTFGLGDQQTEQEDELQPQYIQQEQIEQPEEVPELTPEEQRAWEQGWRPQDQFDGDPDRWKTAREYNMYGDFQQEIRSLKEEQRQKEREFEDRLSGVNKFHEAQLESKVKELKVKQREAVENADTDEFDRIQSELDDVKSSKPNHPQPQQPAKDPMIAAWEEKNPWINNNDQKASDAQALWNSYAVSNPNATIEQALSHVDSMIERLYPNEVPTNPRRAMPSSHERQPQQAPRRNNRELTMNDLTNDERQAWESFGKMMYGDEKTYLKVVADARKQ